MIRDEATAPNPSTALARVLVDELVRCGVTDAVLAPGSRSAALAMALHAEPSLRLHTEIDERSAGFLALGIAKATGRPAPVVTTSGTAVANLYPAVIEADAARTPLIVLSADRPPAMRHTGANQTIDQVKLFGERVRWFVELGVAEDVAGIVAYWRSTVSRAVADADGRRGPAGPVHVNASFREPTVPASDDGRTVARPFTQPLEGRADGRPWTVVTRGARVVPDEALRAFAARAAVVERGLVVVGETDASPGPLLALARELGWPVIAEPLSGARTSEVVIPTAHHLAGCAAFAESHVPDLVLRVGRSGLSRPVERMLGAEVAQVLVDADGAWLDPGRAIGELIVGDPELFCAGVRDHLPTTREAGWLSDWQAADATAREVVDALLDEEERVTEPRAARDVGAAVADGGTLVVGSSMPVRDLDAYLEPRESLRVLGNRGASGIDGFVSTTLGVALASPGPTVALTGDLSLLHDRNGFLLRTAGDVDATFVVVNNNGGGIFSFLPPGEYPDSLEAVFATPHDVDLADVARTHGLGYRRIDEPGALRGAVTDTVAEGGLHLVEVRTDRAANLASHRRITAAVSAALD